MTSESKFGVLFDNDGVILDTETQYKKFWDEQGKIFHPEINDFHGRLLGLSLDQTIKEYFPNKNDEEIVVKRLREFENSMNYNYFPHVLNFISELQEKNILYALVTSSNDIKMNVICSKLPNYRTLFPKMITSDCVTLTKPEPDCYLAGAQLIKINANRCIVFEDSVNGLKAGRAAGCYVIGLATTHSKEAIGHLCDLVINDFSEITVDFIQNNIVPNL